LDASVEFIALLDADTIPHPSWLRELATALSDPRVGVATGNRWYMPGTPTLAAMVRYLWNAAAIVQMYWYKIAWGGTLAVKTSLLRETDLLERWSNSFCEDTLLYSHLRKVAMRVAFVPSLMMVNREDCDLAGFYRWVRRQLLTTRLHHPAWKAVVGHGVISTAVPAMLACLTVVAWCVQARAEARLALLGLVVYQLVTLLMLVPMEIAVRRITVFRQEPTKWIGLKALAQMLVAVLMTQILYGIALFSTSRMRTVEWRGVHYRLDSSGSVRMMQYTKFETISVKPSTSL
jgi:hypothetical protein